jgi:HEAT repeat protein
LGNGGIFSSTIHDGGFRRQLLLKFDVRSKVIQFYLVAIIKNHMKGKIMHNLSKRSFIGMLALAVLAFSPVVSSAAPASEATLIADLASPKEGTVTSALAKLEKEYPTNVDAQIKIRGLLADPRPAVKRKAARVLGVMNADVSEADLKNIAALLTGDKGEMTDGLKALRGLKAQSTIPQITLLLQNSDLNIKRDAIRTLAVLGDKSLVPTIKPFLTYPNLAVQKDAADAISILKEK